MSAIKTPAPGERRPCLGHRRVLVRADLRAFPLMGRRRLERTVVPPVYVGGSDPAAIRRIARATALDPRLEPTDRLAIRWAAGERPGGALHPLEAIRLLHDGAVLGGGVIPTPHDIMKFDQCFVESGPQDRAIISTWYKSGGSAEQKARRLGISRATFYTEWGRALSYFRGWLRAHGLDI